MISRWLIEFALVSLIASVGVSAGETIQPQPVKSIETQQLVYEVVPHDSTALKPGIYKIDSKDGKGVLLLPGHILGVHRAFNGILSQLRLTSTTSRDEAITIVDGVLTIFSSHSGKDLQGSIVGIGTDQVPIVDAVSKHRLLLEPIKQTSDVYIFQPNFSYAQHQPEESVVLISVKQKTQFGEGLTFGVVVRRPTGATKKDRARIELAHRPVLLNYHFLNVAQMSRLVTASPSIVYSHNVFQAYSEGSVTDFAGIQRWRTNLAAALNRMPRTGKEGSPPAEDARSASSLPVLDLSSGLIKVVSPPVSLVSNSKAPMGIVQVDDPLGTASKIYFTTTSLFSVNGDNLEFTQGEHNYSYPGRVDKIERKNKRGGGKSTETLVLNSTPGADEHNFTLERGFFNLTPSNLKRVQNSSILTQVNRRLLVSGANLHQSRNYSHPYFDLGDKFVNALAEAKSAAYIHLQALGKSEKETDHILILSFDGGPVAGTHIVKVTQESGSFRNLEHRDINKTFMTQSELESRMRVFSEGIFLDAFSTPRQLRSYLSSVAPIPHFDLRKDEYLQLVFDERRKLDDVPFSWAKFGNSDYNKMSRTNTGIYRHLEPEAGRDYRGLLQHVVSGTPIMNRKNLDPQKPDKILPFENYAIRPELKSPITSDLRIKIFPLAGTNERNTDHLMVLSNESATPTQHVHRVFSLPAPAANLTDIKVVRWRNQNRSSFSVLFLYKASPTHKGGAYVYNFKVLETTLKEGSTGYTFSDTVTQGWLSEAPVEVSLLKTHVIFDQSGQPLWIDHPTMRINDPKYTVVQMGLAEQGRAILRGLQHPAMFDQTLGDDETRGWASSMWLVRHPTHIEKVLPNLKEDMELNKFGAPKEDKKKKSNLEGLFPTIEAFEKSVVGKIQDDPKPMIVLVQSDLKRYFIAKLMSDFFNGDEGFSVQNNDFNLYAYSNDATNRQVTDELQIIAETRRKKLLIVDGVHLLSGKMYKTSGDGEDSEAEKNESANATANPVVVAADGSSQASPNGDALDNTPAIRMLLAEGNQSLIDDPELISRHRPQIPTIVVMTPAEYRKLSRVEDKKNRGYINNVHLATEFLTASWSLWAPNSHRASPAVREAAKDGVTEDAIKVFPKLDEILQEAAKSDKPAKHQIVVFPDQLKPLVSKLIMSRWASSSAALSGISSPYRTWSHKNADLMLAKIPSLNAEGAAKVTQEAVIENYAAMHEVKGRRSVMIGELGDVEAAGRPIGEDGSPFKLKDISNGSMNSDLVVSDGEAPTSPTGDYGNEENIPHLLWLLATEGRMVQAKLGKGWSLKQEVVPRIPTILYGTQSEWDKLKASITFEQRLTDFTKEFEVVEIGDPPVEVRRDLIKGLLRERPQIRALDLKFKMTDDSSTIKDDPTDLAAKLVARVEHVARDQKQNPTAAFIRVYSELPNFIAHDDTIRTTRVFDKGAIERLLSRVFAIGLNLDSLPAHDPLHLVKDPVKAVQEWQKAGFVGYADLKRKFAEMMFAQTEVGRDDGRPMPFSAILKGPTSTGKTWFMTTFFKMLNMEKYDLRTPNKPADYFILKGQEIVADKDEKSAKLTALKAIEAMEHFLCLNDRGIILADDIHKIQPTDSLRTIIGFFASMFESPGGMFRVRCPNEGATRDIPIRNAGLVWTINPTTDSEALKRFTGKDEFDNDVQAAFFRGTDYSFEATLLARFSGKFDMAKFPAGAKVASILTRTKDASRGVYANRQMLVLTSPHAVSKLADQFGDANARELLSPATSALMELPQDIDPKSPLVLIDLKNTKKTEILRPGGVNVDTKMSHTGNLDRDIVRSVRNDLIAYRAVDINNPSSMLDFLSFMLDNFRIHAYQTFLDGAQEYTPFNSNQNARQFFIGEILISVMHNLQEWGTVPLNAVPLRATDFGWNNQGQMMKFTHAIGERSEVATPDTRFFRYNFEASEHTQLGGLTLEESRDRTILSVLGETAWKLRRPLEKLVAAFYRVQNINRLPAAGQWISQVEVKIDPRAMAEIGQEISDIYNQFAIDIFDDQLLEYDPANNRASMLRRMSRYDTSRMFLQAFDKAIVSMPWAQLTKFTYEALKSARDNHELGYLIPFQDYMFNTSFSPFATETADSIFQSVQGHGNFKSVPEFSRSQRATSFRNACQLFLFTNTEHRQ